MYKAHNARHEFGEKLSKRRDGLSPSGANVMEFIDRNRNSVLVLSALEIALENGTSDATVIRSIRTLDFAGLSTCYGFGLARWSLP